MPACELTAAMIAMHPFVVSLMIVCTLVGATEAAGCSGGLWNISNPSQANDLAEALACSESTQFLVDWYGKVELKRTLAIRNGSILTITGVENAVIAGGGEIRLFSVVGSSLYLKNSTLEGGWAQGKGGAIFANSSSNIDIHSCNLTDSSASSDGGELLTSCTHCFE